MTERYNSIPEPTTELQSLHRTTLAIKEVIEVLTGQRNNGSGLNAANRNDMTIVNARITRVDNSVGQAVIDITETLETTYLSIADAETTYASLTHVSSTYLTASAAGATYLTQSNAAATYLTQSNASSTYLTISAASSTYLTVSAAGATYLTQSSAAATYLTQSNAATTYLTAATASSTYLTISAAGSTYLTQTNAALTYLTQSNAASTYLTASTAASTYLSITDASATYLSQTSAQTSYVGQSSAAASQLAVGITNSETSITVTTGHGDRFPPTTGGVTFKINVTNGAGVVETMLVTSRSGDTMTVTRAQDGTSAIGFIAGRLVQVKGTTAQVYSTAAAIAATYLTSSAAGSTYLTQSNAAATYLTQSDAATTYLTASTASSTYLSVSNASSTYLSQNNARVQYVSQDSAATSQLASSINNSVTSISVTTGTGIRFPSIDENTPNYFINVTDSSGNVETMSVTARSSDTLTVTRAALSTTARSFSSGDRVSMYQTTNERISEASVNATVTAIAASDEALSEFVQKLFASTADGTAEGRVRFVVASNPEGTLASFSIELRVTAGDDWKTSGLYMDVVDDGGEIKGRIRLEFDQLVLQDATTGDTVGISVDGDNYLRIGDAIVPDYQLFNTAGTHEFEVPVHSELRVRCWGGGGGGAGTSYVFNGALWYFQRVPGSNGGNTSFDSGGTWAQAANGGGGATGTGNLEVSGGGGSGGSASGGTTNTAGEAGGPGANGASETTIGYGGVTGGDVEYAAARAKGRITPGDGNHGNLYGGGGGSCAEVTYNGFDWALRSGPGGGGGGYTDRTWGLGTGPTTGVTYDIVVGAGGAGGNGTNRDGGNGAVGAVLINWA